MSISLRSREFVGDFTAWNLECLPCRVGMSPPTRCKYSHFSDQCSVCRCFFFGFIFPSSFGGKDRQAALAGGDCSKLIVEIAFGKIICTFVPKKQAMGDIAAELAKLHILKGADYSRQVERIARMGNFHPIENESGIFSVGGENEDDYSNFLSTTTMHLKCWCSKVERVSLFQGKCHRVNRSTAYL